MTPQQEILTELLTRFPNSHTKTLARLAYNEHKSVFNSVETARSSIRLLRGANGKHQYSSIKEHFRPKKVSGDPFGQIPQGLTHFEEWAAVQLDGPMRAAVIADTHIPYHDRTAILAMLQWLRQTGVDTIVLAGDIADFFSVSFWEKDPRKRQFAEELKTAKAFLQALRKIGRAHV